MCGVCWIVAVGCSGWLMFAANWLATAADKIGSNVTISIESTATFLSIH